MSSSSCKVLVPNPTINTINSPILKHHPQSQCRQHPHYNTTLCVIRSPISKTSDAIPMPPPAPHCVINAP
ncbi:hypothetical protein CEP52_014739 [Fusarium oligoseptatum]|uniref:Uncharacterized protein n=2 Tax=Fusarium solani species complex TaxID=232080 RepID=A0A428SJP4_9HYPO|nr:hypothetical protein CEP51_005291 [Fusarium floridanum]RSL89969.1 hypothetical protein CEP52_014739 [Fusarium oligoseptatum]